MIGVLLVAAALAPAGAAPPSAVGPVAPPTVASLRTAAPNGAVLHARLSPAEITVGDRVRVELEISLPPGERWGPPSFDPRLRSWGDADLLARGRPQALPGQPARYRLELLLTAFRPGKVTLPPLTLAVAPMRQEDPSPPRPLTFTTPPLSFEVRSVLPPKGEATPQPPTPPQPLPLGEAFWWATGGLALACLAAAALLFWRRRGLVAATSAAPPLPPLGQFLRELAALAAEPSPERVHTGISLALRHLLAALLTFPAAERTTSEIDRELRRGRLEGGTRRAVLDLLRRCDEVKFARRPTTREEARARLAAARAVGETVERELAPPPATAEESAA